MAAAGDSSPDFQDWELLVNSDSDAAVTSPNSNTIQEADDEGVLRLDYFSLENDNRFRVSNPVSEEGSVESDNPSWIDPGFENQTRFSTRRDVAEFWSDSGSDRSDDNKFRDFDVKNELGKGGIELGIGEIVAKLGEFEDCEGNFSSDRSGEIKFRDFDVGNELGMGGIGEIVSKEGEFECCEGKLGSFEGKIDEGFEDFGGKLWSDNVGVNEEEDSVVLAENKDGGDGVSGEADLNSGAVTVGERRVGSDEEKRRVVWWKVPFELLKYCVFRISPVWTFSMAAAVMGFVILGRRLYKMKRKARSLPLKVTVDDKKVSQFMSRAARLNEAFSVVRRVPIVRPLLPAASGVNSWPVMTLR
ncbi:hypothetical protein M5689_016110 [Euphorbia peplus]|nr:hypothetical protein M5689_016110 [Euphorbia peplus]